MDDDIESAEADTDENVFILGAIKQTQNASAPPVAAPAAQQPAVPPPAYVPVCEHNGAASMDAFGCSGGQLQCVDGLVYDVITYAADGTSSTATDQCIRAADAPEEPEAIDIPGEVLRQFKRVHLPESAINVQPPNGETLVNLPTIFSTQAPSFTRDVVLDKVGITVELRISADSFTWHFGDGQTMASTWAGEPWSEGKDVSKLITHTYASVDEDAQVRVDTTWSAQWRVKGTVDWRPVNGTVTVAGQAQELDVLEARPLLVKR